MTCDGRIRKCFHSDLIPVVSYTPKESSLQYAPDSLQYAPDSLLYCNCGFSTLFYTSSLCTCDLVTAELVSQPQSNLLAHIYCTVVDSVQYSTVQYCTVVNCVQYGTVVHTSQY